MIPFLKWAGGKTQLLPELLKLVPTQFNAYHEPFVGGGALFFALQPKVAFLSDTNKKLINAYKCVRDHYPVVVSHMRTFERSAECYYHQRALLNDEKLLFADPIAAARFIFLNKTCYNGLWRENSNGGFNVPFAKNKNSSKFLIEKSLLNCSIAMQGDVSFYAEDYTNVTYRASPGDLVYFDPPYIPLKNTSFVKYTMSGFDYNEHVRLRNIAIGLKSEGVHVIISNSDTSIVRELYKDFEIKEVQARRSINSNTSARHKVGELIIT